MKKLIVEKKFNEKKLSNVLLEYFQDLSFNILNKALRQKDIKVNGSRVKDGNTILNAGDIIEVYIAEKLLYKNHTIRNEYNSNLTNCFGLMIS